MATDWPDYELIDFGDNRRLERFAGFVVDRPCPQADRPRQAPSRWREAAARYDGARAADGDWRPRSAERSGPFECRVPLGDSLQIAMAIRPTPAGQVGLFPEQLECWRWIAGRVKRIAATRPDEPPRLLNLFAYTGGSTLAAAAAGAAVTHVDASKPSVQTARDNAKLSGLAEAPIRWIVEDAVRYCQREVRRGSRYDLVVLDPPTYGHGPGGSAWRIDRDLPGLLELCAELAGGVGQGFLATCHTPGVGPAELTAYLSDAVIGHCGQPPRAGELLLSTADNRKLRSGVWARWP
ncbi:class I SAM-dependent methyltransferase [Botrimarina sp.]|uniref:class I SAM-dependent methyltransferase n=1 Tax=Botrimarina sp. TaxID=2795802 RepID=UPI0032F03C34